MLCIAYTTHARTHLNRPFIKAIIKWESKKETKNWFKMISTILYSVLAAVVFILDVVKFCYKLTKIGCSWLAVVTVLLIVVLTRYFRLKKPPSAVVDCILGNAISSSTGAHRHDEMTSIDWWPIANRAACLDALENSKTAIEKVRPVPKSNVDQW